MIKGVVRRFDNLGRMVVPREIRKTLNIDAGDPVDIYLDGRKICIEKMAVTCVCCGKSEDETELKKYKGVLMCPDCHPDTATKGEG